jgi:antitoxin component of MazEF toxin-antitoxin module
MITANIRKQGSVAIMTIPSDVLRILDIGIGATLELEVTEQGFIAHLPKHKTHQRYTLDELLRGVTPESIKALNKASAYAREGRPMGRELL